MRTTEGLSTDTRSRILSGAYRAVQVYGLSRFTMEDAAREAGLSRQTIYRYFGTKDDLVLALIYREEEAFLDGVRAAHMAHAHLGDAIEAAVLFCLRAADRHPLIGRLLRSEPEVLLPYLTTMGGGLISRGRAVLESLASDRVEVEPELLHRAADISVRAIVSYIITPPDDPPEVIAGELARIMTDALTTASSAPAAGSRHRPQEVRS